MTPAERYILLGLRLGRHVDGLVDSYYGPAELKEQADGEELVPPEQLAADGAALLGELEESWLRDCVRGLETYARVLAGEQISYSEEIERCYGVRPERVDKRVYEEGLERLDELLPGEGTLAERREVWRADNRVDPAKLMPVMHELFAEARLRTHQLFGLPEGEEITLEEVHDEPWWAFNYYQGNRRSRIVVNVDVPTTWDDLFELCCHEGYPGHHTEGAIKEVTLVEERGQLEQTINMVPTPQSVLAEGIATTSTDVLGDEAREAALAILARHGVEYDHERARAIREALESMRGLSVELGLMIHEEGASEDDAVAYAMKWGASTEKRARHQTVRFVTDPTWRAYAITYSAGGELAHAYHQNDPARFKRLLTENVRISELSSHLGSR
jgi:hypothetical protein